MNMEIIEPLMRYLDALETMMLWSLFFGVSGYVMAGYLVFRKIKEGKKNESV